jgi:hypothetical protein
MLKDLLVLVLGGLLLLGVVMLQLEGLLQLGCLLLLEYLLGCLLLLIGRLRLCFEDCFCWLLSCCCCCCYLKVFAPRTFSASGMLLLLLGVGRCGNVVAGRSSSAAGGLLLF